MTFDKAFPVLILTGLSGAGKSTALNVFEDLRFYCVDGLPVSLLPKLVDLFGAEKARKYQGLALGIDIRQPDFLNEWREALRLLRTSSANPQIIFFKASLSVLMRRYATTRRLHPLESHEVGLDKALEEEKERLRPVEEEADLVVDTSEYSIHDLRRVLQEKWTFLSTKSGGIRVYLITFGFKYGVPLEADLVFDLRFLPNPYFVQDLRSLSGKEKKISEYVFQEQSGKEFQKRLNDFLTFLIPLYAGEGRYRLTIALGCTGGKHRSVAVAERVFNELKSNGYATFLEHRHVELG